MRNPDLEKWVRRFMSNTSKTALRLKKLRQEKKRLQREVMEEGKPFGKRTLG